MNSSTVVLLGAGFSRALSERCARPYPLTVDVLHATNLLASVQRWAHNSDRAKELQKPQFVHMFPALCGVLTEMLGFHIEPGVGWYDAISAQAINYESVISHCLTKFPWLSLHEQHQIIEAQEELYWYLSDLLNVENYPREEKCQMADTLVQFLDRIPRGSLVFTTNQDNILERLLYEVKHGSSFSKHADTMNDIHNSMLRLDETFIDEASNAYHLIYIKLHGSITWRECTNSLCQFSQTPVQKHRGLEKDCDYAPFWSRGKWEYCDSCGSRLVPALFPPITMKDYSARLYATKMVSLLSRRIRQARRVIIIGYGFPAADLGLKSVILSALSEKTEATEFEFIDFDGRKREQMKIALWNFNARIRFTGYESLSNYLVGSGQD